jgi:hypothetical protein
LFRLGADRDDTLAVWASRDIVPGQRGGREVTAAVSVEPLLFVELEAKWSDEMEVLSGERVQRVNVGRRLRMDSCRTDLADLVFIDEMSDAAPIGSYSCMAARCTD